MARNDNRIQISLDFNRGDTSALQSIKKDILEIKELASNLDFTSGMEPKQIQSMVGAATTLEKALNNAFDVDLNTYNIQKFNQILSQSGHNAASLQASLSQAGAVGQQAFLKATTQLMKFNTVTKQTNKFLDDMATSFFNTVRWGAMSSILNSISGTVQRSVSYIKELDTGLNDIRIVTGKSADEMSRFASEANEAAKQLAVTTADYTEGSLIYYQQGLDDETVKTLTDVTAKTSNVTGQAMEEVSEQLTAVWNGYRVANEAAEEGMGVYEEYVDKMAAVGAATASDLEELSTAMSKVAAAASSMGVDFDDLNAQIATIVSVTRQAPESVGTALKTIYARLGDLKVDGVDEFGTKLGEVSSQLQTMGINILDTNGDMRDMTSVMTEVAQKWETWTSAQRQAAAVAMAGKRQYNNLIALFDNWDMYGEALETSMNAAGTLEQQQEIALDSLQRKMMQLRATAEDFYDSLFDENSIKGLVEAATEGLQLLADFADSVGGLNNILPLLGSTALRVFNTQIADGLGTIIINARNAKQELSMMEQNAEQLRMIFADSHLFDAFSDSGVNEIAGAEFKKLQTFYTEMQSYQQIMTAQEKEQYNLILQNIEKAGTMAVQAQEAKNEWKNVNNELKLINGNLINNAEDVDKLEVEVNRILRLAQEIEDFGSHNPTASWASWGKFLKDFEGELRLTEEQITILENKFTALGENLTTAQKLKIISDELREIGSEAHNITNLTTETQRLIGATEEAGNSLRRNLDTKAQIADITNMIGAVGQLSMGLTTLGNIGSILSNDDLDFGEKFLQTAMNLSFVLPMIGSSIDTLGGKLLQYGAATEVAEAEQVALAKAEEATALRTEIKSKAQRGATISTELETAANIADKESEELNNIAKEKAILTSKGNIIAKGKEVIAILAHKSALDADTQAAVLNKAAMLGALAAIGLVVAGIAIAVKAREKYHEEQIENAKADLEEIKVKEDEIKTNQELVKSYDALYKTFKETGEGKDDLYNKSLELVDAYDIEGGRVLALAGNYEELTRQIKAKQAAELEDQKAKANEGAETASSQAAHEASTGRGYTAGNRYKFELDLSNGQRWDTVAPEALQDYVNKSGKILNANIDYSKPEEMLKWIDAVDQALKELEQSGDTNSNLYKQLKEEQDQLAESAGVLKEQLELLYQTEVQSQFLDFDFADSSTQAIYDKIQSVKENLKDIIPEEDQIDDFVNSYLNGIDGIDQALAKIDIAEKFGESSQEFFDTLDSFNESQLAYLMVHLDTAVLDGDLKDWLEKHKDIVKYQGNVGASEGFRSLLGDYKEKEGFSPEQVSSIYENSNMAEFMAPSQEQFNAMDQAQQLQAVTEAWIENTKEIERNKEVAQENLEAELSAIKVKRQEQEIANGRYKQELDKIIEANKKEEDSLNDIIKVIKKLKSKGYDNLSEEEEEIYDRNKDLIDSNGELINNYLDGIKTSDDLVNAYETTQQEIDSLANNSDNYAEILSNLNTTQELNSKIVDDIQSAYKTLNSIIDDYNKTHAFTIDQVQELMTMDDSYVATLQFENGQLVLNEQAFQNLTIAKINDMEQTAVLTAQEELEALAENNVADASMSATSAILNAAAAADEASAAAREGAAAWDEYAASMRAAAGVSGAQYDAKAKEITDALRNRLQAAESAKSQVRAGGGRMRTAMGVGGGSKGGGGGKGKQKEKKEFTDEIDRYYDLNKAIEKTSRAMDRFAKIKEHLHGVNLTKALEKEAKLIERQRKNYTALIKEEKKAARQEQAKLKGTFNLKFNEDGSIKNYAKIAKKERDRMAAATKAYNKSSQSDADKAAYEKAEKRWKLFQDKVKNYDDLIKKINDDLDKREELRLEKIKANFEKFENKLKVKLDKSELDRDIKEFTKSLQEDITKSFKDYIIDINFNTDIFNSNQADAENIQKQIEDTEAAIDKMMAGGKSKKFATVDDAQEYLKELYEQYKDSADGMKQAWEDAWDAYLSGIDQAADKFDLIQDRFDKATEELEYQGQLIELIYGEEAYNLMGKLYDGQNKASLNRISSLKKESDMWKEQLANAKIIDEQGNIIKDMFEWNEDEKKYYEQWQEAQSALKDEVVKDIEIIKKEYENSINDIFKKLEEGLTGGKLSDVESEWERITAQSEKYYDNVESAYQIQTLSNSMNESITSANLKNQQRLQKVRDQELAALREKDKLTEYDIKRAELRYQLELKQIALENSQNNKNSMKLTRNAQGNWSYQYVADENDVASKRQELLDTWNELYQLSDKAYQSNLKSMQDLTSAYLEKSAEIARKMNETTDPAKQAEYQAKLQQLNEEYYEDYARLAEENAEYREDLEVHAAGILLETYNQDIKNYESMTAKEKELVDELKNHHLTTYGQIEEGINKNLDNIGAKSASVMEKTRDDWSSKAQQMADYWNKDDGKSVKAQVTNAYNDILNANTAYKNDLGTLETISGEKFGETGIKGDIDAAVTSTETLTTQTKTLADTTTKELPAAKDKVDALKAAWEEAAKQIKDATKKLKKYIEKVDEIPETKTTTITTKHVDKYETVGTPSGGNSGGGSGGSSGGGPGSKGSNSGKKTLKDAGYKLTHEYMGWLHLRGPASEGYKDIFDSGSTDRKGFDAAWKKKYKKTLDQWAKDKGYSGAGLRSGGYTGTWNNDDGRWAVLHQKELVLNKEDTSNFLSGIQMIRDMSSLNGSINNSILKAISNMMLSLPSMNTRIAGGHAGNGDTQNVFNITAEFPNAENVNEIREAILSLPNIASQYIN